MDNNQHTPEPVDEKRWGGPGSSHQNAKQEPPEFEDPRDGGPAKAGTSGICVPI